MSRKLRVLASVGIGLLILFVLNLVAILIVAAIEGTRTGWFTPVTGWAVDWVTWSFGFGLLLVIVGVLVCVGLGIRMLVEWIAS